MTIRDKNTARKVNMCLLAYSNGPRAYFNVVI